MNIHIMVRAINKPHEWMNKCRILSLNLSTLVQSRILEMCIFFELKEWKGKIEKKETKRENFQYCSISQHCTVMNWAQLFVEKRSS